MKKVARIMKNKTKYLHVFPRSQFLDAYVEFINIEFNKEDHLFLVHGKLHAKNESNQGNVVEIKKTIKSAFLLIKKTRESKKIFLHGLFSKEIIILLFFQPWLLRKCNWIIWGGDLYHYKFRKKTLKSNVFEKLRKFVIKRMGTLITHIKGDYELAQRWYGARGKYFYSFMYPSNTYRKYSIKTTTQKEDKIYIQIGNSADPTNNHLKIMKGIEKYKEENIEIICPLSYGNRNHMKLVIAKGESIFGRKFTALTDFLSFSEYLRILSKVDIAIFNHERQQAMGNIITLIGLGKKVYIRNDITTWDFCNQHELKVFSSNEGFEGLLHKIGERDKERNIMNVKIRFSIERLIEDWKRIVA